MAYIEMVHSFKRYHMGDITITANNDVSFGIERGELAIILGSSGAGKSTVLNILGGMDTNSEGKVIIDGVRHLGLQREATDRLPAQQHRIRVSVLQSGGQPHRQGERGTRLRTRQERGRSSADAGRCGTWRPRPSWPRRKRNWPRPTRRSPPDRRNCRRHGRNWLKDRTSSPIHGTSWRTAKRSGRARDTRNKQTVLDKVGATLGKWEQTGITGKLYEQIRGKYDMAINQYNEACAEYNRQLNAYQCGTATIPERRSAARPRFAGVSEQCGQSRTGIQTDSRKTKRARQSGVAGRQASRRRRHAAYPRPEGHRQGRNGIPEQTRRIQRAEARSRTQDIRSRTADNPRRGEDRQSHRPGLFRQRPPRRPDLARLLRVHGHRRHRGETGGHLPDLPLLRRGARHLQHHGTHGGRGTHQFRNVEGARLRQRGCDAQIHRIRIRRIRLAHASACSPATRCCRLSSPTHTARDSPCRTSCSNSTPGSPWPHSHLHG